MQVGDQLNDGEQDEQQLHFTSQWQSNGKYLINVTGAVPNAPNWNSGASGINGYQAHFGLQGADQYGQYPVQPVQNGFGSSSFQMPQNQFYAAADGSIYQQIDDSNSKARQPTPPTPFTRRPAPAKKIKINDGPGQQNLRKRVKSFVNRHFQEANFKEKRSIAVGAIWEEMHMDPEWDVFEEFVTKKKVDLKFTMFASLYRKGEHEKLARLMKY